MFAALLLLSFAGIAIFFALSLLSNLALRRWHESALVRERYPPKANLMPAPSAAMITTTSINPR
jgi:hypothetical protein